MTEKEIKRKIDLHAKWLREEDGGEQADLSGANLSGANLSEANLSGANLSGANLSEANLSEANLSWANLSGANLSRANLSRANLSWANLSGANLSGANLFGANLSRADLSGATIDYSCWPLWCVSLDAKIDRGIFCQLAYHLCRCVVDDDECRDAQRSLYKLANEFHRANECGRLGEKE